MELVTIPRFIQANVSFFARAGLHHTGQAHLAVEKHSASAEVLTTVGLAPDLLLVSFLISELHAFTCFHVFSQ